VDKIVPRDLTITYRERVNEQSTPARDLWHKILQVHLLRQSNLRDRLHLRVRATD
jgi:hypothetical protein